MPWTQQGPIAGYYRDFGDAIVKHIYELPRDASLGLVCFVLLNIIVKTLKKNNYTDEDIDQYIAMNTKLLTKGSGHDH